MTEVAEEDFGSALAVVGVGETFRGSAFIGCTGRTGGGGGKRARRGEREQTSIGARNGERELTTQKRGDSNHTSLTNVGIFIPFLSQY